MSSQAASLDRGAEARRAGDNLDVVGGLIPLRDYGLLRKAGVSVVFGPGTTSVARYRSGKVVRTCQLPVSVSISTISLALAQIGNCPREACANSAVACSACCSLAN